MVLCKVVSMLLHRVECKVQFTVVYGAVWCTLQSIHKCVAAVSML